MIRTTIAALLLTAAAPLAAQNAFHDRDFRVTNIEAHLLYERTGRLSADVTDNPEITLFNTIIGEGSAEEEANDLLVTAIVSGPGEFNMTTPLVITVRNEQGRVVATRRIANMLVNQRTYRSILLQDAGCAGVLQLTAELGASRRTERIELACGE